MVDFSGKLSQNMDRGIRGIQVENQGLVIITQRIGRLPVESGKAIADDCIIGIVKPAFMESALADSLDRLLIVP